jgi:hypothetical protein
MQLPVTLLLGGIFVLVLLLGASLRKKVGDDSPQAGSAAAAEAGQPDVGDSIPLRERIVQEAIGFDLRAHPRPTRSATDSPAPAEDPAWRGTGDRHAGAPYRVTTSTISGTDARPATDGSSTTGSLLSPREAAEALGVTPDVLLAWEERYGYPKRHPSSTTPDRLYSRAEVLALAESLQTGVSIPSAIDDAQAATKRRRATARRAVRKPEPPTPG